jgi:hypothetical protein
MEFFEIAGEMRWECEKVLTERFPVRVLVVRSDFSQHLIAIVIAYVLAYVSRGPRRGGGAVNGTWLEADASVTLEKLFHWYRESIIR